MTMAMPLLIAVKVSVVFAAALAAARLLRGSPAGVLHRVWSAAFALALVLPALAISLPAVDITVPGLAAFFPDRPQALQPPVQNDTRAHGAEPASGAAAPASAPAVSNADVRPAPPDVPASPSPDRQGASARTWLTTLRRLWTAGCAAGLLLLVASLLRVRALAAAGVPIDDPAWTSAAADITARLGARRVPALLVSRQVSSPMAGGVVRPAVFLPPDAYGWSAERRDVVLTHEIAHLASRDPLRHLLARVVVACYWFHPLAWLAAHRATVAREQACDEAVLAAGTRPSTYARVLVDLADSAGRRAAPLTALPMAQRSHLEKRVMTILNPNRRASSSLRWPAAALALALVTIGIAAARPSAAVVPVSDPVRIVDRAVKVETPARIEKRAVVVQPRSFDGMSCGTDERRDGSFDGTISMGDSGTMLMVGRSGGSEIVQRDFDGLRVCFWASSGDRTERPSELASHTSSLRIASDDGRTRLDLSTTREGGRTRTVWRVNGKERPADAASDDWMKRMLEVLDNTWDISTIRGHVSTLRGEISTIRGHESTLRGEISTVRGRVSTYNGEISTIRGQESTIRGEISTIRGHESTLRGEISSELGAISSLTSSRYDLSAEDRRRIDARIDEHRKRIEKIEAEIRDYDADAKVREAEKRLDEFDTDAKVRAVQKDLSAFDADGQVRAIEKEIDAYDVAGKVRAIEKEIDAYDADRKIAALEGKEQDALKRLRSSIAAIR